MINFFHALPFVNDKVVCQFQSFVEGQLDEMKCWPPCHYPGPRSGVTVSWWQSTPATPSTVPSHSGRRSGKHYHWMITTRHLHRINISTDMLYEHRIDISTDMNTEFISIHVISLVIKFSIYFQYIVSLLIFTYNPFSVGVI